jgi:hypothetical protein
MRECIRALLRKLFLTSIQQSRWKSDKNFAYFKKFPQIEAAIVVAIYFSGFTIEKLKKK